MRKVETVRVDEYDFRFSIIKTLEENFPGKNEVMIVMLREKLGGFNDPIEGKDRKSPVFIFGPEETKKLGEKSAKETIKEWMYRIDSAHYILPKLMIEYFFTILSQEEFDTFLADLDRVPKEWENLKIALKKYKEAISQ